MAKMLTLSQKVKSSCYQALLIDYCILFLKANVAAVLANFLSFDCLPQEGMELDKSRAGKSSPKGVVLQTGSISSRVKPWFKVFY